MIETLHELTRWTHIGAGFVGLAVFWIPLFAQKGGSNHRFWGRVFKYCAWLVLGGAAFGLTVAFAGAYQAGASPADPQFAFLVFLAYLTYVTFVSLHAGVSVLTAKTDLTALNTVLNRAIAWAAVASSVALIVYALVAAPSNRILLFALSPIGFAAGFGFRRVISGARTEKKAWFYEHMGAMLGCGIAFHTAFAVFGSRAIFTLSLDGWMQVVPWIAPTLIGIPAAEIWTRYYQRKFRDGRYAESVA